MAPVASVSLFSSYHPQSNGLMEWMNQTPAKPHSDAWLLGTPLPGAPPCPGWNTPRTQGWGWEPRGEGCRLICPSPSTPLPESLVPHTCLSSPLISPFPDAGDQPAKPHLHLVSPNTCPSLVIICLVKDFPRHSQVSSCFSSPSCLVQIITCWISIFGFLPCLPSRMIILTVCP